MTPPPTTTGVLATAPVADAVVFRPNTDNVQFPLIDSSYNVVAVATGQTSEYIDIDVPAAVQMSPSAATAATATSIPIVGAVGPSTASLTNTHADSIGGHD